MNSDQYLRQLIKFASAFVEKWYETHAELRAFYHVETHNGTLLIPRPPFSKDEAAEIMRDYFIEKGAVRYVFFDEAWTLDTTRGNVTEEDFARANAEGLADFDHPARREIVMITAEDTERQLMASREIIREGGVMRLGPLVIDESLGMSSGRMVGLLRPRGMMQ